jgi:hypothetical protein
MMTSTPTVRINLCSDDEELYRHYDGQSEAQGCYIELDLRGESLHATYNAEVGNAVPFSVYHGFERRYSIPVLTGDAANELMEQIAPLADRILADWDEHWDGNNMKARLGEDAQAAEEEIESLLPYSEPGHESPDVVGEWTMDAIQCTDAELGVRPDSTDAELGELEEEILKDLAECGESKVAVLPGLTNYLREARDRMAEEAAEDTDED